jgi:hypothetical protein
VLATVAATIVVVYGIIAVVPGGLESFSANAAMRIAFGAFALAIGVAGLALDFSGRTAATVAQ